MNTTIYVNGKRVTKEDLSNIEVHSDVINRIVTEVNEEFKNMEVTG